MNWLEEYERQEKFIGIFLITFLLCVICFGCASIQTVKRLDNLSKAALEVSTLQDQVIQEKAQAKTYQFKFDDPLAAEKAVICRLMGWIELPQENGKRKFLYVKDR